MALFQRVCELDLEGIVAKQKSARYVTEREHSTWCKLLNREYSQRDGREELFERERHSEPVAGWHLCTSDVQSAIEITVVQAGKVADTAVLVQFLYSIM